MNKQKKAYLQKEGKHYGLYLDKTFNNPTYGLGTTPKQVAKQLLETWIIPKKPLSTTYSNFKWLDATEEELKKDIEPHMKIENFKPFNLLFFYDIEFNVSEKDERKIIEYMYK